MSAELIAENLSLLDQGNFSAAINKAIKSVLQDCEDRCSDDRPRKIKIQLEIKPVVSERNNMLYCEDVDLKWIVAGVTPQYESKVNVGLRRGGRGVFSPDVPGNHRQETLFEKEGAEC